MAALVKNAERGTMEESNLAEVERLRSGVIRIEDEWDGYAGRFRDADERGFWR